MRTQIFLYFSMICIVQASFISAELYIISSTYRVAPIEDLEADFGPDVPESGIEGVLKVAQPEDACQPFAFKDFSAPWFALISRQQKIPSSNCTFDIKVMHAQMAGASAAIVYDNVYENLIIMSKPPGHAAPGIPAIFIDQPSGLLLTKLLQVESQLRVKIMPMSGSEWLTVLMSLLMVMMALLIFTAFYYSTRLVADWMLRGAISRAAAGAAGSTAGAAAAAPLIAPAAARPGAQSGLPASILNALPVIVFERKVATKKSAEVSSMVVAPEGVSAAECEKDEVGEVWEGNSTGDSEGDPTLCSHLPMSSSGSELEGPELSSAHAGETKRTCTFCLEDYMDGDKVRVLPCKHRFHMHCVDQWLVSRRFCPVCKHDAGTLLGAAALAEEQAVLADDRNEGLEEEDEQEDMRSATSTALGFASARRRALARLNQMRSGMMFWFRPDSRLPTDHLLVPEAEPLLRSTRQTARSVWRARRALAAAAAARADVIEAGVVDWGETDDEVELEAGLQSVRRGTPTTQHLVGHDTSSLEGGLQEVRVASNHAHVAAQQPGDVQQQRELTSAPPLLAVVAIAGGSNGSGLAGTQISAGAGIHHRVFGTSQPIQVPQQQATLAESTAPEVPPTPPCRTDSHQSGRSGEGRRH